MTKNAVAVKNETLPADTSLFDDFAGEGFGKTTASDFVIPRIGIIGDLSPQLKKNKAEYIEGVQVGDLVDIAMGEILARGFDDETFTFLPVVRVKEAIEWKPRTAGGGIVSRHILDGEDFAAYASSKGASLNDKNEWKLPNGNEIIETHQYYGINLKSGRPSFIPMKKSNLKIARKWFTQMRDLKLPSGKGAPMFYRTYEIGSFLDSGNGNDWPNFTVTGGKLLTEVDGWQDIALAASELLKIIQEGNYRADIENEAADVENEAAESDDDGRF